MSGDDPTLGDGSADAGPGSSSFGPGSPSFGPGGDDGQAGVGSTPAASRPVPPQPVEPPSPPVPPQPVQPPWPPVQPQPFQSQPFPAPPDQQRPWASSSGPPAWPAGPATHGPRRGDGSPFRSSAGRNGFAIASLILGIVWIFWLGSVLALVFGYLALSQIKRRGGNGRGLALAGVTLGWVGVVGLSAIVVASVAVTRTSHSAASVSTPVVASGAASAGASPSTAVGSSAPAASLAPPTTAPGCATKPSVVASPVSGFPNLPAGVDPALGVEPTITVPAGAVPLALATVDLVVGHGVVADQYDTVTANYLGVNYVDCTEFGSTWSVDQVGTYALQDVIPGFRQGIVGMAVGGRREIIVPSWLGYSVPGEGKIAPNEELVFVVDVLAISPPGVRSSSP